MRIISSFVYPFDGVKAIAISNNDYQRLRDGEFLNDTIIDFYLRYHLDSLKCTPQLLDKVHLFNTFFYHKLTQHQNNDSR
ncbi:hypothetical protein BDF22DRAFT_623865 [Syncephalis plumigaleata]|nr:hypothetical protein BDF22DRAFT_623865 [Syncephalis plumigaleata]